MMRPNTQPTGYTTRVMKPAQSAPVRTGTYETKVTAPPQTKGGQGNGSR